MSSGANSRSSEPLGESATLPPLLKRLETLGYLTRTTDTTALHTSMMALIDAATHADDR